MTSETAVLFALRSATYVAIPPSNLNTCLRSVRSSTMMISSPLLPALELRRLLEVGRQLIEAELEDVLDLGGVRSVGQRSAGGGAASPAPQYTDRYGSRSEPMLTDGVVAVRAGETPSLASDHQS
jgi:hypothetical protein